MTEEITWKSLLTKLVNRQTLNYEENSWWINALMNGQAPEAATGAGSGNGRSDGIANAVRSYNR